MIAILQAILSAITGALGYVQQGITYVLNLLKSLFNGLTFFWQFLTDKVYDFAVWCFAGFIEHATLAYLKFLMKVIPFAWDIAKTILNDLGVPAMIAQSWGVLPAEVAGLASVLMLPQALMILLNAYVTRYVLRFIPGMK
jgi:hypothetical protein